MLLKVAPSAWSLARPISSRLPGDASRCAPLSSWGDKSIACKWAIRMGNQSDGRSGMRRYRRWLICLTGLFVLSPAVLAFQGGGDDFTIVRAGTVPFEPVPQLPGLEIAVLAGDPAKEGPYVLRVRFAPGVMTRRTFTRKTAWLRCCRALGTPASARCSTPRRPPRSRPAASCVIRPARCTMMVPATSPRWSRSRGWARWRRPFWANTLGTDGLRNSPPRPRRSAVVPA